MTARPRLFFVRHGETDWNAEGRLQGKRDTALNDTGRGQAQTVGRLLRDLVPGCEGLDFIASPLARTRETMELLRHAIGLPRQGYHLEPRLAEISFGEWEGRTWKELRTSEPDLYAARKRDCWHFTPPGGESYAAVAARVRPLLEGLTRDTLVVSHGGVARAVLTLLSRVATHEAPHIDIWPGRILVFDGGAHRWAPV